MATKAGYVAEHRLVMAAMLGRMLLSTEVVHHDDGNPENNAPENLELFASNGEHLAHELAGRVPNWSEAGRAALRETVIRKGIAQRGPAFDASRQRQRSVHF